MLNSLRRSLYRIRSEWEVAFEPDPKSAVARATSSQPDVVVTDLNMPELTGIEMIVEMRKSLPAETVFILLTGAGDLEAAIAAINHARIFRFLTKPCAIDALVHAIEEGLTWRRGKVGGSGETSGDLADAALRRVSTAVVVVDRACMVTYINESAGDIIAGKNGMIIDREGACRALVPDFTKELKTAVREASTDDNSVRYLRLPAGPEKRDLHIVVEALTAEHVALFLADPEKIAVPPLDGIQALFGLTRAEATVAHALAAGGSLEDASVAGGITISSARTYLKRVFSKTGVSRQAELIQLLLTTPTPAPRTTQLEAAPEF